MDKHDVKESKELIIGLAKIAVIILSKVEKNEKFGMMTLVEMINDMLNDEDVSLAIRGINKVLPELKDLQAQEIAELLSVMIESGTKSFKKLKNNE